MMMMMMMIIIIIIIICKLCAFCWTDTSHCLMHRKYGKHGDGKGVKAQSWHQIITHGLTQYILKADLSIVCVCVCVCVRQWEHTHAKYVPCIWWKTRGVTGAKFFEHSKQTKNSTYQILLLGMNPETKHRRKSNKQVTKAQHQIMLIGVIVYFIKLLVYPFTYLSVGLLIALFISLIYLFIHSSLSFARCIQTYKFHFLYRSLQTSDRRHSIEEAAKMEDQLDPAQWQSILSHLPHSASAFIEVPNFTHHPTMVLSKSCSVSLSAFRKTGSGLTILHPLKKFNTMQHHVSQTYQKFQRCCHCRQQCCSKGVHAEGTYFKCE